MKTAYFDCFSGISGDMIIGALLDLGLDFNFLKNELKKLDLKAHENQRFLGHQKSKGFFSDYEIATKKIVKNGIAATKFDVSIKHERNHEERNLKEINEIIKKSKLDNEIKNTIKKSKCRSKSSQ